MTNVESRPASWWTRTPPALRAFLIVVVVAVVLQGIGCVWGISTLSRRFPVIRDFETIDLLLDTDTLPPGWRIGDTYTHVGVSHDRWSENVAARVYDRYGVDGSRITEAYITIWRYNYPDPRNYAHIVSYCSGWGWNPPPAEITFTSQYADQWNICCMATFANTYACAYSAAYDEFLVDIWFGVARSHSPEDLLIRSEEINALFAAQDQRMAEFLDLEPQE